MAPSPGCDARPATNRDPFTPAGPAASRRQRVAPYHCECKGKQNFRICKKNPEKISGFSSVDGTRGRGAAERRRAKSPKTPPPKAGRSLVANPSPPSRRASERRERQRPRRAARGSRNGAYGASDATSAPSILQNRSGRAMFATPRARAKSGAISAGAKPAIPQPISVTRNFKCG